MILAVSLVCLVGPLLALLVLWNPRSGGRKPENYSQGNAKDEWQRESKGCAQVTVALLVLLALLFGGMIFLSLQFSGGFKLGK